MTEAEAVTRILDRCAELGLLAHHDPDARKSKGSPGFPDLVIAGVKGLMFIEMKLDSFSKVSSMQTTWRHTLKASGQTAEIFTVAELPGVLDMIEELAQ
jgi:hypothetical protein